MTGRQLSVRRGDVGLRRGRRATLLSPCTVPGPRAQTARSPPTRGGERPAAERTRLRRTVRPRLRAACACGGTHRACASDSARRPRPGPWGPLVCRVHVSLRSTPPLPWDSVRLTRLSGSQVPQGVPRGQRWAHTAVNGLSPRAERAREALHPGLSLPGRPGREQSASATLIKDVKTLCRCQELLVHAAEEGGLADKWFPLF